MVRSIAFQQELWKEVHYGEYAAKCGCCKSFRTYPEDIEPKAKYDNHVRQAVLDRILADKLNVVTVQQSMKRDFLLELSTGFIYDCLDFAIRKFDGAEFRAKVFNLAWKIWRRMRRNQAYLRNEHLCKALEVLNKDNITKLLTYLDRPPSARSKVRTNNHVERCNRVIRYLEKVRYKWRRRRTIVRHILLQFANWIKRKENKPAVAA